MSDKVSSDEKKIIEKTFKTFVNLLKEFPKSAAEDFIYDEATIEKIENAGDALSGMANFFKQQKTSLKDEERKTIKESLQILSQLMNELPRSSEDEFSYEPMIHQMVESARGNIVKLGQLFP